MAEESFYIPAAAQYAKNHHVFAVDAVDDNVRWLAIRKNRSVMESTNRSAMSALPLLAAM